MEGQERARAIVAASLRLFARRGCAGTATREIARAAGCSEALVFKHFPTKDHLYRAILEEKISEGERTLPLDDALRRLPDETFFLRLATVAMRRVAADDSFLRLLLLASLERHQLARAFQRARLERVRAIVEERVRSIQRATGRRPIDPGSAARLWTTLVLGSIVAREVLRDPALRRIPVERHARALVRLFLHGIGARQEPR